MRTFIAASVLALMALSGGAHAQTYQISMPLGGTSGTFYTQGAALADYINSRTTNLRIVPSTSGGSVENIRLVGSGQGEIGMAFASDVYGAWVGDGFERDYTDYRVIGPAQKISGWNFLVLASSDVESVTDLVGRNFVSGAPGSGSAADADKFLRHIGLWDQINIEYNAWGELGRMLTDGDIVGFNRTGPAPAGFAQEIDATHPVRVLNLEPQIDESSFLEEFPFFSKLTIPAGTYSGQENDAVTFAQGVQWIAHKDVPEEVIREFLQLAYTDEASEHLDRTFPAHDHRNTAWAETLYAPLHPGAAAFWQEQGLSLPDPLRQ